MASDSRPSAERAPLDRAIPLRETRMIAWWPERLRERGAVLVAGVALSAIASCILADPAPELPKPASLRPTIVKGSVSPSASEPIGDLPVEFLVPVELADPTRPFEWKVFVDFRNITDEHYVSSVNTFYDDRGTDQRRNNPGDGFGVSGGLTVSF